MRPELPFLAAGAVALVGAVLRDGKLPASLSRPAIGVAVLVILAAATQRTKVAPVVNAFGMLLLTGTALIVGQILYDRLKKKRKG